MLSNNNSNNNNSSQERILKNTSYLTIAFILQKILSFLYFIYIARSLGPVDLGLYDPVKSLIPIFLILIDFSLSVVLVREIARKPDQAENYLGNVLGIKIIFALIIVLGMGLYTNLSAYPQLVKNILYLDAVIVTLDTFTLTFFAVFRGLQNMKYEAIGIVGTQIITIIFGVLSLRLNWGLQALFYAVVFGSIFNFIFSYSMLRRKLKIRVFFKWDISLIKKFLRIAIPFAIAAIFVKAYTYTDRFMLLKIAGQKYVGWYVTAHKLTYALEFVPSAFAASIFPAMSSFFIYSKKDLAKTFVKAMHFLMILALPISFGIFVLAKNIILTIYGPAYESSIIPLRILISGLIVVFLNFPVGAFLNACNKQIINTINMGIIVAINIMLNIYFIWLKGMTFTGAAISALISGIILFLLGLRWVGKIVDLDKNFLIIKFLQSLAASFIMGCFLWIFKDRISIFINIPTGVIIYAAVLYFIKGISKKDARLLLHSLIK